MATLTAVSKKQWLRSDWKRQNTKCLVKRGGKNTILSHRKIQLGDKAEVGIGEADLKAEPSSASNHTHAKVRVTQKVPDTEQTGEGDANTSCSGVNAN